jgi:hypothetical protein
MIRHGDVLLVPVAASEVGADATVRDRDKGRVILAYGEVTGHAHAITEDGASILESNGLEFLRVENVATLRHEEHATVEIPAGTYKIVHQREYSPEAIRNVLD